MDWRVKWWRSPDITSLSLSLLSSSCQKASSGDHFESCSACCDWKQKRNQAKLPEIWLWLHHRGKVKSQIQNRPPNKIQHAMTQCVSDAAPWDPYLPSWPKCLWGPRTQQKHKQAGPGRVASRAQINRPEIRVLRKQSDPAGRYSDVRTEQQAAANGGEGSRSLSLHRN